MIANRHVFAMLLLTAATLDAVVAAPIPKRLGFMRGMTVSCQTYGPEWATPEMEAAMDELKGMGVEWIAIHPYARIQNDGSLKWDHDPANVLRPGRWAKEKGMHLFVVPHIAYWGTPWLWRGEISFDDAAGWNRFFASYEDWIVHEAEVAQGAGAELFSVGLEYGLSQKYEARWRAIIQKVRGVFHGKLTYGANWNEVENVSWWGDLDYIGVLAYFPLTKESEPSEIAIRRGWRGWIEKLDRLSKNYGKPVLFTEIGYHENDRAAAEPWAFNRTGGPDARGVQVRCIDAALQLENEWPTLAGLFWWKWFPNLPDHEVQTFDLRKPWTRAEIEQRWAGVQESGGKATGPSR